MRLQKEEVARLLSGTSCLWVWWRSSWPRCCSITSYLWWWWPGAVLVLPTSACGGGVGGQTAVLVLAPVVGEGPQAYRELGAGLKTPGLYKTIRGRVRSVNDRHLTPINQHYSDRTGWDWEPLILINQNCWDRTGQSPVDHHLCIVRAFLISINLHCPDWKSEVLDSFNQYSPDNQFRASEVNRSTLLRAAHARAPDVHLSIFIGLVHSQGAIVSVNEPCLGRWTYAKALDTIQSTLLRCRERWTDPIRKLDSVLFSSMPGPLVCLQPCD